MSKERRSALRIEILVTATYRSTNLTIDAQVKNLSQTGLFLACKQVDLMGTRGHVELDRSGDTTLIVPGTVVWSDEVVGMGVRFAELSRDLRLDLANFIIERVYR